MPSMLTDILDGQKLAGVNTPYLYIGGFRTMFAWHTEDLDMASINILHTGKPKFWYCIGRKDYKKLDQWVKTRYPEPFVSCSQFMRHKTILANPYLLKKEIPDLQIEKLTNQSRPKRRRYYHYLRKCLSLGLQLRIQHRRIREFCHRRLVAYSSKI